MIEMVLIPDGNKQGLQQHLSLDLFRIDTYPLLWFKNDFEFKETLDVFLSDPESIISPISLEIVKKMAFFYLPYQSKMLKYGQVLLSVKASVKVGFSITYYDKVKEEYYTKTMPIAWSKKRLFGKKISDIDITDKLFYEVLMFYKECRFDEDEIFNIAIKRNSKVDIAAISMLTAIREIIFSFMQSYFLSSKVEDYDFRHIYLSEYLSGVKKVSVQAEIRKRKRNAIGSIYRFVSQKKVQGVRGGKQ